MNRGVFGALALIVGLAGGMAIAQTQTFSLFFGPAGGGDAAPAPSEGPAIATGAAGAAGSGASGAEAARWRMASAFGSQWPIQGELGVHLVKRVGEVTGGTVRIQFFEPNALVPLSGVFEAVSEGSIDAAWSSSGYWAGKIPALQFFTAVPFGPGIGEYLAWLYAGGAEEMYRELYAVHGIHAMHCGLHSPEGSGWFRKEIRTVEDLQGLKMRFFGLGGRVMEKLGVSTQPLAAGEIFPALELGTIDAAEYSMPLIDLNQGFYQIAEHYYFPGWHQQTSLFELLVSAERWNALSPVQQTQIESVCKENFVQGAAIGEAAQAAALQELKEKGVQFHTWPPEILAAMKDAWREVAEEESAKDADFARIAKSYFEFHNSYRAWAELGYL